MSMLSSKAEDTCQEGQGPMPLQAPKLSEPQWHKHYLPGGVCATLPDLDSTEDMLNWLEATQEPTRDCIEWLQKTGREFDERMDLRIKTFYGPDSAVGMQVKQALQLRSREHALTHIGISGRSSASSSESMADLVEYWDYTYETILTEQQRQGIKSHFTEDFVSFINTDLTGDALEIDSSALAEEWSFCSEEERAYLKEIIDCTQNNAEREGLRAAYEVLWHSNSPGGGAAENAE